MRHTPRNAAGAPRKIFRQYRRSLGVTSVAQGGHAESVAKAISSIDITLMCCNTYIMIRTQIQLPDELYRLSKKLASRLEISLAELVRRGLEYEVSTSPALLGSQSQWKLPEAKHLGGSDPFAEEDWREQIHTGHLQVAEDRQEYSEEQGDS